MFVCHMQHSFSHAQPDLLFYTQGQPNYLNDSIAVGDIIVSIDGFDAQGARAFVCMHMLGRK